MENLFYTNEFLKKLEPIIVKNDIVSLQKIKEALAIIAEKDLIPAAIKLENQKTKSSDDIFVTETNLEKGIHNIFWTIKNEQKIIITLTKDTTEIL